jgi:hypothetical protein
LLIFDLGIVGLAGFRRKLRACAKITSHFSIPSSGSPTGLFIRKRRNEDGKAEGGRRTTDDRWRREIDGGDREKLEIGGQKSVKSR